MNYDSNKAILWLWLADGLGCALVFGAIILAVAL